MLLRHLFRLGHCPREVTSLENSAPLPNDTTQTNKLICIKVFMRTVASVYCCVTNHPKCKGFKQSFYYLSQCCGFCEWFFCFMSCQLCCHHLGTEPGEMTKVLTHIPGTLWLESWAQLGCWTVGPLPHSMESESLSLFPSYMAAQSSQKYKSGGCQPFPRLSAETGTASLCPILLEGTAPIQCGGNYTHCDFQIWLTGAAFRD